MGGFARNVPGLDTDDLKKAVTQFKTGPPPWVPTGRNLPPIGRNAPHQIGRNAPQLAGGGGRPLDR